MTARLLHAPADNARTVRLVTREGVDGLDPASRDWARESRFEAGEGSVLLVPGEGGVSSALLGTTGDLAAVGALSSRLPEGDWRLEGEGIDADLAALFFLLGDYRFERYKPGKPRAEVRLHVDGADAARAERAARSVFLVRDLVNTPASDMGPQEIEDAVRALAEEFGASVEVTSGDALASGFPMIHAVGRASTRAPRLIDLRWGREGAPRVTLVGKGVAFDTGGLDIKPAAGMLLMKKDMGGAANVLGLARLVMAEKLDIALRVLIPAVENAISGEAFRPGDVLRSRKGKSVEIGNTDAEGRLVLADALALADEEAPEVLIDMATLTGAARVALGPDLPPFFTDDERFAADLAGASQRLADPLWRMPLWKPYAKNLSSRVADVNNVTTDGMAGAVTAALFLQGFVEKAGTWAHLDTFAWRPKASPLGPIGGEAQGIRGLFAVLEERYGKG